MEALLKLVLVLVLEAQMPLWRRYKKLILSLQRDTLNFFWTDDITRIKIFITRETEVKFIKFIPQSLFHTSVHESAFRDSSNFLQEVCGRSLLKYFFENGADVPNVLRNFWFQFNMYPH